MKQRSNLYTLEDICNHYQVHGYIHQQIELQQYTIEDVEGIVSGYTPRIMIKGHPHRLWCCSTITDCKIENLIKPYLWPHPHQWWMSNKETFRNRIANRLKETNALNRAYTDFEELYDSLRPIIIRGDLFRYDLARRIGYCLNVYPKEYVYLHEGAKEGAEILDSKGYIKIPKKWSIRVHSDVFEKALPNIDAIDIENLLCIYKRDFTNLKEV